MEQLIKTLKPDITLTEMVEPYAKYKHLRPATKKNYRDITRLFSSVMNVGEIQTRDITLNDALGFRERILLRAKPVSWNTYNRHLRALLNFAVLFGLRGNNPFDHLFVRSDRIPPTEKVVGWGQIQSVVNFLRFSPNAPQPGWFWETVVLTLVFTLIRRRQLVELTWGDVQFEQRRIRLRGEASKNHRSRYIPIHPHLLPMLIELRDIAAGAGEVMPADQVFNVTRFDPRYTGQQMTGEQVSGFFKRLTKKTGVTISSHRMRHTSATRLLKNTSGGGHSENISLRTLQQLLGHSSITTTAGYIHPKQEDLMELVESLQLS